MKANPRRMTGFGVSVEFGSSGPIRFDLVKGKGRITAGIYVRKKRTQKAKKASL